MDPLSTSDLIKKKLPYFADTDDHTPDTTGSHHLPYFAGYRTTIAVIEDEATDYTCKLCEGIMRKP